jgi:hypothetical protein
MRTQRKKNGGASRANVICYAVIPPSPQGFFWHLDFPQKRRPCWTSLALISKNEKVVKRLRFQRAMPLICVAFVAIALAGCAHAPKVIDRKQAEQIALNAARHKGFKGELKTSVMTSAPFENVPETGDHWLIWVWEKSDRGRSASVWASDKGKVVGFDAGHER